MLWFSLHFSANFFLPKKFRQDGVRFHAVDYDGNTSHIYILREKMGYSRLIPIAGGYDKGHTFKTFVLEEDPEVPELK